MQPTLRAYIQLHTAVLLFGLTAILGDLISISAISLVWWRVLITSLSLLFFVKVGQLGKIYGRKRILQFMGIGTLVALHWIAFYGSIKLANASIALVCMATVSFFTAFIEPLIFRTSIKWLEVLLSLLIIPGMMLIVNSLNTDMMLGFWIGLLAAFLAALFSVLNKKLIETANPYTITFLELGSACLFISLMLPFYLAQQGLESFIPKSIDWIYLLILALVCTTLAYTLSLNALKTLSAFASNLVFNLEPVYGIALAWIILKENQELSPYFYYGVALILVAVFVYPILQRRARKMALD